MKGRSSKVGGAELQCALWHGQMANLQAANIAGGHVSIWAIRVVQRLSCSSWMVLKDASMVHSVYVSGSTLAASSAATCSLKALACWLLLLVSRRLAVLRWAPDSSGNVSTGPSAAVAWGSR